MADAILTTEQAAKVIGIDRDALQAMGDLLQIPGLFRASSGYIWDRYTINVVFGIRSFMKMKSVNPMAHDDDFIRTRLIPSLHKVVSKIPDAGGFRVWIGFTNAGTSDAGSGVGVWAWPKFKIFDGEAHPEITEYISYDPWGFGAK